MKRLIPLLLFLWCIPAHATCWYTDELSGSASTVTVSVSPTAGDLLVAWARHDGASGSITLSDDSGSNSWTMFGSQINNSFIGGAQVGSAPNVAGGTYTVTATFDTSHVSRAISVCSLSGMATSSPTDGSGATCTATSGVNHCTSGSFSTTNAADVLTYWCTVNSASPAFSAGAIGGTTATLFTPTADDEGGEYRTVSATQSGITADMTTSGNHRWLCQAVAFKQAGGGGGGGTSPALRTLLGVGQ